MQFSMSKITTSTRSELQLEEIPDKVDVLKEYGREFRKAFSREKKVREILENNSGRSY